MHVIDKLNDRHFGVIAFAMAKLDDSCITTVTVFIPQSELIEKSLDGFNAG